MNPLLLKLRLPDFRVAGLGRALAVTTLLAAAEAAAAAAGWEELPPLPAPNGGQAAGAAGGKVIVVSGTNWEGGVKNWLKAVHEFDPARRAWRTRGNLEQAQAYSLAVESHGSLLVLGGSTGAGPFGGVARVDAHGASQSPQGGLATPAVLAAGGRIGHELFFVGGTDDAANVAGFRRDAFAWDLQTGRQRALEPYPGQGLGSAGGAAAGGELFVFGGARWDAENKAIVNLTAAYAYSPQTGKWRPLAP
ncbi:MAG: hypothetical protein JNG83_09580, partial [Opitutaceae bacterium]|nr:hypothetical protein [Opitutaceae bacterium]